MIAETIDNELTQQEVEPGVLPEAQQPAVETPQERNFKEVRQARARAERERDEALARLRSFEESRNQPIEDDDVELAPDDLVEWKHVQKKISKLENKLKSYEQQSSASFAETRIRNKYQDFDAVVTHDNLQLLSEAYPELAASISSTPDLYNQASSAYTLIKKLGISQGETYSVDKERIAQNAAKPRPLAAASPQQGDSPLSHANAFANGLTPDLKKQLFQEMMEARKNR